MAHATFADVEARYPEVDASLATQVETLLDDVEILILQRIPDLDAQITAGTISERMVVMVECNAVIRVLRNPDALVSETDGNYSYMRSAAHASGMLEILTDEWDLLGQNSGFFMITPVLPTWYPFDYETWRPILPY